MATTTELRQTATESVHEEAVFISGPRRGQIVSIPHNGFTLENGDNALDLNDEQAVALQILASELTKATSGLNEVISQVQNLNSRVEDINRRLSEPT